jgi:hypothetical protein
MKNTYERAATAYDWARKGPEAYNVGWLVAEPPAMPHTVGAIALHGLLANLQQR